MAQKSIKRQIDEFLTNNDDLSDDESPWGGRKRRYLHDNYILEFPDTPDHNNSDETETIYSYQSKSTAIISSESDISTPEQFDDQNNIELQLPTSSFDDEKSSSGSTAFSLELVPKQIKKTCEELVAKSYNSEIQNSDNGYIPDECHDQITNSKIVIPPACFQKCVQCLKGNPNPHFQYCYTCYRDRKELMVNKPKPKNIKRLKMFSHIKEINSQKDSQMSAISNLQPTCSTDISSYVQEEQDCSKSIMVENTVEHLCNICYKLPKNGVINHGRIGHVYCCYPCAKKLQKKNNRCPICNAKITSITKMIVV